MISLICNSVHPPQDLFPSRSPWHWTGFHPLDQMPWLLRSLQAGLELATLSDLVIPISGSSSEGSSPLILLSFPSVSHCLLPVPIWVTAYLAIYDTSFFPHDFPRLANVYSSFRLGKGHLLWKVPTSPPLSHTWSLGCSLSQLYCSSFLAHGY
jgi:hypothetical protein